MKQWKDRVAVVTGAASGIGAAITKDLLKAGLIVVGLDKMEKRLLQLKENLPSSKRKNFHPIICDVNDMQDVNDAFDLILSDFGGVDILINNAGIHRFGKLCEVNLAVAHEVMQTNVMSVVHCTQRAFKSMKERQFDGHIIFMNSISGHMVPPASVGVSNMYIPTKHAMTAINEVFRQEFRDQKTGVKVTNLCPGLTATEMVPNYLKEKLGGNILQPENIAETVMFIINLPSNVQVNDIVIKAVGEGM